MHSNDVLAIEQELPEFDRDSDGFPRPGQVIRYFRQMKCKDNGKMWTQRDLAQALGKQELAVRDMELRDTGLNDINRRRLLAQLFDIPLVFLGLIPNPKKNQTNAANIVWWVEKGFPEFDASSDGFPRPGQVIRYFRQMKCKVDGKVWTQRDLAQVLGKQELAIRDMELRDTSLNDISRRRFLVRLFAIPPLLLGLATIPKTNGLKVQQVTPANNPKVLSIIHLVDYVDARDQLTCFWGQNTCTPQYVLLAINSLLKQLYERYPTTAFNERIELVTMLCEFHIHACNILRDNGKYNKTLEHLQKAKDLSMLLEDQELRADVLYRRGGVYLEKGKNSLALDDYHATERMMPNISTTLQAALLLETALSEARVVKSQMQRTSTLNKLDRVGHLLRVRNTKSDREKYPYLNVDNERYHLDRAATLIALKMPKDALCELDLLSTKYLSGRRSIYRLILQAQAYFCLQEYSQAAFIAEDALTHVRVVSSQVNLERIKILYKGLRQTSFQNNPEVERLDYLLFHT